jgi:Cu/Ag efflux protein CusF
MALLIVGILGVLLTACAPQAKQEEPAPKGVDSSRHTMTGVVVSADAAAKEAIIEHDEIPDVMGAMRMGFSVPDAADREKLKPGAKIKATLVMENNTMWVEGVQVTGQGEAPAQKTEEHHHH